MLLCYLFHVFLTGVAVVKPACGAYNQQSCALCCKLGTQGDVSSILSGSIRMCNFTSPHNLYLLLNTTDTPHFESVTWFTSRFHAYVEFSPAFGKLSWFKVRIRQFKNIINKKQT